MPTLLQITTCRIFGIKPLSETMLAYYQLDPQEHTSVKFQSEFEHFHWRKSRIWKCRLQNMAIFFRLQCVKSHRKDREENISNCAPYTRICDCKGSYSASILIHQMQYLQSARKSIPTVQQQWFTLFDVTGSVWHSYTITGAPHQSTGRHITWHWVAIKLVL